MTMIHLLTTTWMELGWSLLLWALQTKQRLQGQGYLYLGPVVCDKVVQMWPVWRVLMHPVFKWQVLIIPLGLRRYTRYIVLNLPVGNLKFLNLFGNACGLSLRGALSHAVARVVFKWLKRRNGNPFCESKLRVLCGFPSSLVTKRQLLMSYAIDPNYNPATQSMTSDFSLLLCTQTQNEAINLVAKHHVNDRCKEVIPLPGCLPQSAWSPNVLWSISQLPYSTCGCAFTSVCFLLRLRTWYSASLKWRAWSPETNRKLTETPGDGITCVEKFTQELDCHTDNSWFSSVSFWI